MTGVEIKTIADAVILKQTWVKKSFYDMMEAWEEITKDMGEIDKIYIGAYSFPIHDECVHHIYLIPNEDELYFREEDFSGLGSLDYYTEKGCLSCGFRDKLTIQIIRFVTPLISDAITKKFRKIQADIDDLSQVGCEIRRISNCLNR